MLLQWALVGLFGLYVIKLIWPDLNDAFGIMLPTGFYGGHGTAAAIGSAFEGLGWDEARSLGMTTATVGVICSIIGGLLMVKWAAKHKQTAFISDFDDLPDELRSGLLPEDKRDSIGEATTSSISIDTLTFHVALVFVVAFLGYMVSQTVNWGGEEFLMIVFGNIAYALKVVDRVQQKLRAADLQAGGRRLAVTMTFGICEAKEVSDGNIDEIIRHADQRLYLGKTSGKNCIKIRDE